MNVEASGIPGGATHFVHLLKDDDLLALVAALGGSNDTGGTGTDDHHVGFLHDLLMGLSLGRGLVGIGNTGVVTDLDALAAGDTLLGIDPVFCVAEGDGVNGTFHPALMTAGAEFLIDYIRHIQTSFSDIPIIFYNSRRYKRQKLIFTVKNESDGD